MGGKPTVELIVDGQLLFLVADYEEIDVAVRLRVPPSHRAVKNSRINRPTRPESFVQHIPR
jgi:hypothetical protein